MVFIIEIYFYIEDYFCFEDYLSYILHVIEHCNIKFLLLCSLLKEQLKSEIEVQLKSQRCSL